MDDIEDALDGALNASQDFQRNLMRAAMEEAIKQVWIYKLRNSLDAMTKYVEDLERAVAAAA
jgi:glucose-6-phosphate isomerase